MFDGINYLLVNYEGGYCLLFNMRMLIYVCNGSLGIWKIVLIYCVCVVVKIV